MPLNKFVILHDEDSTQDLLITQSSSGWMKQVAPGSTVEFMRSGEFHISFVEPAGDGVSSDPVSGIAGIDDAEEVQAEADREAAVAAAVADRKLELQAEADAAEVDARAKAEMSAEASASTTTTTAKRQPRGSKKDDPPPSGGDE